MPELPEVETVVRGLRRCGFKQNKIIDVRVSWPRTLAGTDPAVFEKTILGACVCKCERRAKYIVLQLSNGWHLLIHLRMTGSLRVESDALPRDPYERVALVFEDGRALRFRDTRKFGRWYLVQDSFSILGKLGPEPLGADFTVDWFFTALRRHNRMLKPLLLDQTFLAGLGNIYVDEALFAARLHPCRIASSLSAAAVKRLHKSIRDVLELGISRMGTSLGHGSVNFYSVAGRRGRNQDALMVFRRNGEPCLVCGTIIQRMVVGQRSTHFCGRCQVASKVGAGKRKRERLRDAG